MLKTLTKLITLFFFVANIGYAEDYGSGGKFVIKAKVQGVNPSTKSSKTDTNAQFYPIVTNNVQYPVSATTSAGNVLGVAAAAAYFLSDNIAVEASTGFVSQKVKVSGIGPQISPLTNQVDPAGSFHQSTKAGFIPFAVAVQYHIAPYGKISPYLGAGYHYTFATSSSDSNVGNSRGAMFQAGIDGWINSNLLYNIEFKKMFMNPRISFRNNWIINSVDNTTTPPTISVTSQNLPTSTRIKLDPIVISAGIGIRL